MSRIYRVCIMLLLCVYSTTALAALVNMEEHELDAVSGQALFWSDKITPNSLAGAPGDGSANFTFYRMGLDVELEMNMNIAKLQLGCGGINNAIASGCDIDMDYVRFLGRNGSGPGNAATSDFKLTRPYVSLAIKNDNNPNDREVVGFKLGAQSADGFVGVGRRYDNGQTNQEHGGVCNAAVSGNSTLNCHSGINSLSGFLGSELSAGLPIRLDITGVFAGWVEGVSCTGAFNGPITNPGVGTTNCNSGGGTDINKRNLVDISGTRLRNLVLGDTHLSLISQDEGGLSGAIISGFIDEATAEITTSTRNLGGFALIDTQDFFISFQRERVSWPRYSKTTPGTSTLDACNSGYTNAPGRCSSAYAVAANTGWWMNVPEVKLLNIVGAKFSSSGGLGETLAAVSAPGLEVVNPELNLSPPDNCYGSATFC